MYISYDPLWKTLINRKMRKEDLRIQAGLTTNIIANMGKKGKNISMDTLIKICETLQCDIADVIELVSDDSSAKGDINMNQPQPKVIETENHYFGRWANLHKNFLRDFHPDQYNEMLNAGTLNTYLADFNEQVEARIENIINQMKIREGVTEDLKSQDQMGWAHKMNNIRNRAEEIVMSEMVFS